METPILTPSSTEASSEKKISAAIFQRLANLKASINRTSQDVAKMLWANPAATPESILANSNPADARAMMGVSVIQRVTNAFVESQVVPAEERASASLSSFENSGPVPVGKVVVFKDAQGQVVDLTPEAVAFLAKLSTVESVDVQQGAGN